MKRPAILIAMCGYLLLAGTTSGSGTLYVDADASGPTHDGSSWCSAYTDLQEALEAARAPSRPVWQILVAGGVYKPAVTDRTATFRLINGVEIKGGYAGCGEPDPDERDIVAHETILSGDLNRDDGPHFRNRSENTFHVVTGGGTDETAVLEGFTISGGYAHGGPAISYSSGGGMYIDPGSPTVRDCTFRWNMATYGGGLYISNFSTPNIIQCVFEQNFSPIGAGACNCDQSTPTFIDCVFSNNLGDGMVNRDSSPELYNCSFRGNRDSGISGTGNPIASGCTFSENRGTAMIVNGSAVLNGCTFSNNTTTLPYFIGGLLIEAGRPTIHNCMFVENASETAGAISIVRGEPMIEGCTFINNQGRAGTWAAGAIMVSGPVNANVANCQFEGNSSTSEGGAIYVRNGNVYITNCNFNGNSALSGGGIFNYISGSIALVNCNFTANAAFGYAELAGGIENFGHLSLTNCILWDNVSALFSGEHAQIHLRGNNSTLVVNHSAIEGWTGLWGGIGNTGADPLFVDSPIWDDGGTPGWRWDDEWYAGDPRLQPGSPCIDAGDNDAAEHNRLDLDGLPRFVDDPATEDTGNPGELGPPIVDMGAYEYQPRTLLARLDIRPEMCPNRISRSGRGLIRVAIVGTESFDVADVDIDSLVLTRHDGEGGEVHPLMQPHGLRPKMRDVSTPFDGELCDCHRLGRDGVDDLVLRFDRGEIVNALRLKRVQPGTSLELMLSASLLNGTAFEAADCVVLIGKGTHKTGQRRDPSTAFHR